MIDATGRPQRVLLLGGTSEIGLAIVSRLLQGRPGAAVLVGRDAHGLERKGSLLAAAGHEVTTLVLDATEVANHGPVLEDVLEDPIDVAILAIGQLGEQSRLLTDPVAAARLLEVNLVGGGALAIRMADRFRAQGYGHLIVLSSVAAERPRTANYVYGASKAGLDALSRGLSEDLRGSGAGATVLRPGFVHTRMTAGMRPAPFATTPQAVADIAAEAVRSRRAIAYAPSMLRWVMYVLRLLPRPLFRRLPG
jgi:decaprenylphospho-beta-D-erythro-pentofuranosid-2-ulose 2-reductase